MVSDHLDGRRIQGEKEKVEYQSTVNIVMMGNTSMDKDMMGGIRASNKF